MSLTNEQGRQLIELARQSIAHGLQTGRPMPVELNSYPAELREPRATFVTVKIADRLRGCIGVLEAFRPLVQDITENAFAAAFRDSRFPPLDATEFEKLSIHLALLTHPEPLSFSSEADLLAQLQPGKDGLILQDGHRRGTFLPAVWETLPNREQFLRHLKQKAGLPADYWSDSIRIFRYYTEAIG